MNKTIKHYRKVLFFNTQGSQTWTGLKSFFQRQAQMDKDSPGSSRVGHYKGVVSELKAKACLQVPYPCCKFSACIGAL